MANKQAPKIDNTNDKTKSINDGIKNIISSSCVLFTVALIVLCAVGAIAQIGTYLSIHSVLLLLLFSFIITASMRLEKIKAFPKALCFILQFVIFMVSFHILFFVAGQDLPSGAQMLVGDSLASITYFAVRGIAALIKSKIGRN
jgi:hypothetical protein